METTYATVREAGIAGSLEAMRLARLDGVEHGGFVLKTGDRFSVSRIVGGDQHSVKAKDTFAVVPDVFKALQANDFKAFKAAIETSIAGQFHAHIGGPGHDQFHEWFSPQDLRSGILLRVLSYLGASLTGRVFEVDARSHESIMKSAAAKDISLGEDDDGDLALVPVAKGLLVYEAQGFEKARAKIKAAELKGKREKRSMLQMLEVLGPERLLQVMKLAA